MPILFTVIGLATAYRIGLMAMQIKHAAGWLAQKWTPHRPNLIK